MNNDLYFNPWSPFDPDWYQKAFDQFMSTADQLFLQEEIIKQGYHIPSPDGSRSSVFRNTAVLNNSFNEETLREALKDIYFNLSHKLVASNHDNVSFFQWHGNMSDMHLLPSTNMCEFRIPLVFYDSELDNRGNLIVTREEVPVTPIRTMWINPKERDLFKLSQFYRKWIKIEDLLNNWDVFKWHLLLFVNQRIYSEYELYIDEQEIIIRFPYHDFWITPERNGQRTRNFNISFYRFDTNYSRRVKISRELCNNQWNWLMPISFINDDKIKNQDKVIVAINRIADTDLRSDDRWRGVEILGDNLEFLEIKDGHIDLSNISDFNRNYINSESDFIWMSIFVPKFFHEYPILLPTDVVHRPYQPDLRRLMTTRGATPHVVNVKNEEDEDRSVFVDVNPDSIKNFDGWLNMIRPIVFADAFEDPMTEPYDSLFDEMRNLRDVTVQVSKRVDELKLYIRHENVESERLNDYLDKLKKDVYNMYIYQNKFFDIRQAPRDQLFEWTYNNQFFVAIDDIRKNGIYSSWLGDLRTLEKDFWEIMSTLINISKSLVEKYYVVEVLRQIRRRHLWSDPTNYLGESRFQRPIESHNFWMFEYDHDTDVWRPSILEINRHFPDVYLLKEPNLATPTPHKVYKAFFFYADNMNVLEESNEIRRATPSWNDDIIEYHVEPAAIYRDIFMEKFYWMGVRAIYKGLMMTNQRWEAIEFVINNPTYQRFNELFIHTMDPYFKLGLATYLKSPNFEFPFDDAVAKMEEAITLDWNGFAKITNFEVYLNKHWIPSYFDYIVRILDDWDYESRLRRRPSSTFDMRRLQPIILEIQFEAIEASREMLSQLQWAIEQLQIESFNLNIDLIIDFKSLILEMLTNLETVNNFIRDLDLETYSIDDINIIINHLSKHEEFIQTIHNSLEEIYNHIIQHSIHDEKLKLLEEIVLIVDNFQFHIDRILEIIISFDMNEFMLAVNDLRTLLNARKINPEDRSLIGEINQFNDHWSQQVQKTRNNLFVSTSNLFGLWDPNKMYTSEEVHNFVAQVEIVRNDLRIFRRDVEFFWSNRSLEVDQVVIDRMDYVQILLDAFEANVTLYYDRWNELLFDIINIRNLLSQLYDMPISDTERGFINDLKNRMDIILGALSYISGHDRRDQVENELLEIENILNIWYLFIQWEREIFQRLLSIVRLPNDFFNRLNSNLLILQIIQEYLNQVNNRFIPDAGWPTFSDVFSANEININNGGFRHMIGDWIFVPNVGVYEVTSVDGEVSRATSLECKGWTNTTFRNPMIQPFTRPYGSISNGHGAALNIHVLSVHHIPIINDNIINPFLIRIRNVLLHINQFITIINPHNNNEFKNTLNNISNIQSDWIRINNRFGNYLSNRTRNKVSTIMERLNLINDPANSFIELRSRINVRETLELYGQLVDQTFRYFQSLNINNIDFFKFNENGQTLYVRFLSFFGMGTAWNDINQLRNLLNDVMRSLTEDYSAGIFPMFPDGEELNNLRNIRMNLVNNINQININLNQLRNRVTPVSNVINLLEIYLDEVDQFYLQEDIWYRIHRALPALQGINYRVGDVVKIEYFFEKKDQKFKLHRLFGEREVPHDVENVDLNVELIETFVPNGEMDSDFILFQVSRVDKGKVTEVRPFMDYAIQHEIWGIHSTTSLTGIGTGLTLDIFSTLITKNDSTLLLDENSRPPQTPRFDDNDLFMFKFSNIYSLNIQYEVFLGGKQITNYIQRHEQIDDPLHPNRIDVIYINANEVMNLQNSSIYIPAENYFIFKINDIEIIDPGMGYAVNQDIFVDAGVALLRLRVAKLVHEPYKGIEEISLIDGNIIHKGINPRSDFAKVVTDTMNNIDDEFTVSRYDKIPAEGIKKPATLSFPQDEFEFISRRFDELDGDNRNEIFMYPTVEMVDVTPSVENGDPEFNWYQGSRIYNSFMNKPFNQIDNIISLSGPYEVPYDIELAELYLRVNTDLLDQPYNHNLDEDDFRRWEGIDNVVPPTNPFIPDNLRWPMNQPPKGEYQLIHEVLFHNSDGDSEFEIYDLSGPNRVPYNVGDIQLNVDIFDKIADLRVPTFNDIPRHINDWPEARIGSTVLVEIDETQRGHRTLYRLRTQIATGFLVFNNPIFIDRSWNHIDIDWMNEDWLTDFPNLRQQYQSAPWRTSNSYREIEEMIDNGMIERSLEPQIVNNTTYIHDLILNDISVFNWTLKKWENLSNRSRWRLEVRDDPENKDWGFRLTFVEPGSYRYHMKLYLNKTPDTQMRNATLRRDAIMSIRTTILEEVNNLARNLSVNTGRSVRIRKLFPYEQREVFQVGYKDGNPIGYEMDFKLNNYMHFKNQLLLGDVKIFNLTTNRFEDLFNRQHFEIRFKDDRMHQRGEQTHTRISRWFIDNSRMGMGFRDGDVWGYNVELGIHIFGNITVNLDDGSIQTFTPTHCPNPPTNEIITLEFQLFQNISQSDLHMGLVQIEFRTMRIPVYGDGYIHDEVDFENEFYHSIYHPMAPLPEEFKIIVRRDLSVLNVPVEYEVSIVKTARQWKIIEPHSMILPTFELEGVNISNNNFYVLTHAGRLPLINPSTGIPSFLSRETPTGTDFQYLNVYRRYEHLEIRSLPYPIRSVFNLRRIPKHGFIDLQGKINKPLNKKYFEFWVNGRLLYDEVTIITPTKFILHGLTSLRNLEIIEVNRDPNEFFSDQFLEVVENQRRPDRRWNYKTYLDAALEGTLEGDNYTVEEQEYLLSPVWNQVDEDHPSFKDYPPNMDIEEDIILRIHTYDNLQTEDGGNLSDYSFLLLDLPTLEGIPIVGQRIRWSQFGLREISNQMIIDLLNEEWSEEIKNDTNLPPHVIISEDDWFGTTARLYDEFGVLIHNLNESLYQVYDHNVLNVNSERRTTRIIQNEIFYDLT